MEDVAVKIQASWYYFGICLGIEDGKLRAIEQSHPTEKLRCFSTVYSIWKEENLKPLTWEVVVQILKKDLIGQRGLSLSIAEKYSVQI